MCYKLDIHNLLSLPKDEASSLKQSLLVRSLFTKVGNIFRSVLMPHASLNFWSPAPQSLEDKLLAWSIFRTDVVGCLPYLFLSNV